MKCKIIWFINISSVSKTTLSKIISKIPKSKKYKVKRFD